jgi:hypothetical protein
VRAISIRVGSRELTTDELEAVVDRGEIGARQVDLAQGEWLFVWHDTRCASGRLIDGQRGCRYERQRHTPAVASGC